MFTAEYAKDLREEVKGKKKHSLCDWCIVNGNECTLVYYPSLDIVKVIQ